MKIHRLLVVSFAALLAGAIAGDATPRYVAQNGQTPDPLGEYTTWAGAASNIQDAVSAADAADTVWVSNGVYTATSGAAVVSISKGIALRGFSGNPDDVVIDGGRGTASARRGLSAAVPDTAYLLLDALTISNGFTTSHASGLYISHSAASSGTAMVHNCVITDNVSSNDAGNSNRGGGAYTYGTIGSAFEVIFSNSRIRGNHTWKGNGAGLLLWGGRVLLENCLIERNSNLSGADSSGGINATSCPDLIVRNSIIRCNTNNGTWAGGVEARPGHLFENCVIQSNKAFHAGGIFNRNTGSPPAIFRNCLISHNVVSGSGGGIWAWGSTNVMENCTIVDNSAHGIYNDDNNSGVPAEMRLANCIIYDGIGNLNSTIFATNCTAQSVAALTGPNNNTDDPAFVDYDAGDYRLTKQSAGFNTGTNLDWMVGAVDLDGFPRIDAGPGIVDRGCYEYVYYGTIITVQ